MYLSNIPFILISCHLEKGFPVTTLTSIALKILCESFLEIICEYFLSTAVDGCLDDCTGGDYVEMSTINFICEECTEDVAGSCDEYFGHGDIDCAEDAENGEEPAEDCIVKEVDVDDETVKEDETEQ